MLSYVPEAIGDKRGVRTWHEGMHHFFYPSSPHAEEFALAIAEAASVGGNYVTCYNLFPALPITDTTDPFNQRIYREIKRMYTFLDTNSDLAEEYLQIIEINRGGLTAASDENVAVKDIGRGDQVE